MNSQDKNSEISEKNLRDLQTPTFCLRLICKSEKVKTIGNIFETSINFPKDTVKAYISLTVSKRASSVP